MRTREWFVENEDGDTWVPEIEIVSVEIRVVQCGELRKNARQWPSNSWSATGDQWVVFAVSRAGGGVVVWRGETVDVQPANRIDPSIAECDAATAEHRALLMGLRPEAQTQARQFIHRALHGIANSYADFLQGSGT